MRLKLVKLENKYKKQLSDMSDKWQLGNDKFAIK